jgi:hypothetical protein
MADPMDVQALTDQASTLAASSITLADRLARIETRLGGLPAKVEVRVEDSPSDPRRFLSFGLAGGSWGLSLGFLESEPGDERARWRWAPIAECAPEHQAVAAQLLPGLVATMFEAIAARARGVRDAHAALDEVDRLLASQGGAPRDQRPPAQGAA